MITLVFLHERPVSLNKYYSGGHWSGRAEEAKRVHSLVRSKFKAPYKLLDVPVGITVTAYFKDRSLDADNITSKLYIDGLKDVLLFNDSPKYVKWVKTIPKRDKLNPRVEIYIEELE